MDSGIKIGILEQVVPYTDISVSKLIFSISLLIVGFALVKLLVHIFRGGIEKTKLPDLPKKFLMNFLSIFLDVIVFLIFLKVLGFDVDSYIVGLSTVIGLVLSLGMQDTFKNIAAGMWVASTRPVDMGETVTVNGQTGKVMSVGVMSTGLLTPDNQLITIPNQLVWGSSIVNMTRMPTRRTSVDVGISYSSDIEQAIKTALDLMKSHPLVLQDPQPAVVTTELASSSVNLQLRAWAKTGDIATVKNNLTAGIYEAYKREGIEIPFPQMEICIKEVKETKRETTEFQAKSLALTAVE